MKKFVLISTLGLLPLAALAQPNASFINDLSDFATRTIIPFLIVIATLVFIFGIIRYITAGGDEEKLKAGRNLMIYGIIALAVMVAVWGIVKILVQSLGIGGTPIPDDIENPF